MTRWEPELETAIAAGRAAGEAALAFFEKDPQVSIKADQTPVSEADHAADRAIRERIAQSFPKDGFLSEEAGEIAGTSGRRWIIDPVDGTRSFLRRLPYWSNLIGLEAEGEIVVGVVHLPALGRIYGAARGLGAWRDHRRLQVRDPRSPAESLLVFGELDHVLSGVGPDTFDALVRTFELVRAYGDGYGPALVLEGQADAWIEYQVALWDIAPFSVLFEEAGARFTNLEGRREWPTRTGVAAAPALHQALLESIQASKV